MKITDPFLQHDFRICCSPRLAKIMGSYVRALLLHQIEFWVSQPKNGQIISYRDKKTNTIYNRKWVKETIPELSNQLMMPHSTLQRNLQWLRDHQFIYATDKLNYGRSHDYWYSVNFDKIWSLYNNSGLTDKVGVHKKKHFSNQKRGQMYRDMKQYQTQYHQVGQHAAQSYIAPNPGEMFSGSRQNRQNQNGQPEHTKMGRSGFQNGNPKDTKMASSNMPKRNVQRYQNENFKDAKMKFSSIHKNSAKNSVQKNSPQHPSQPSSVALKRSSSVWQQLQSKAVSFSQYFKKVETLYMKLFEQDIRKGPQFKVLEKNAKNWYDHYCCDFGLLAHAFTLASLQVFHRNTASVSVFVSKVLKQDMRKGIYSVDDLYKYQAIHAEVNDKASDVTLTRSSWVPHRNSTVSAPQAPGQTDDPGVASQCERVAEALHTARTGDMMQNQKIDYKWAHLVDALDKVYMDRTGRTIDDIDPHKYTKNDWQKALRMTDKLGIKYSPSELSKIKHYRMQIY